MVYREMQKALSAYGEVLRLVRRLPEETRAYYAKYARENFVNYREVNANDTAAIDELLHRTYAHSVWVLNKYSVDESVAGKLKEICSA
ncbi:hypothetical protein ACS0TY_002684 [Phlomoides rotata]